MQFPSYRTIIKFCYNYKLFVFSEKQSIYTTTRSDSAAAVTSERWSFTTRDFNCRKLNGKILVF